MCALETDWSLSFGTIVAGSWNKVGRCSVAPLGARLETRWGALQLSASGNEDSRSEAEKEAAEWAEMAAKMEVCAPAQTHGPDLRSASCCVKVSAFRRGFLRRAALLREHAPLKTGAKGIFEGCAQDRWHW